MNASSIQAPVPQSPAPQSPDDGMSLVEMLVALALLAMIGAVLAGSLSGIRGLLSNMERTENRNAMLSAQSYLRKSFAASIGLPSVSGGAGRGLTGTATVVQFLTTYSPQGQLAGVQQVLLQLSPSAVRPGRVDLVATDAPVRANGSDGTTRPIAPPRSSRLLTDVVGMSLSYFGNQGEPNDPPQWSTTWNAGERLPRAVRLSIQFGADDPRSWPAIDFPLALAEQGRPQCHDARQLC